MNLDLGAIGKWVFFAGCGLALAGAGLWLAGRFGLPLGRLPGDLRIEREGFSLYLPITTSILLSLGLSLALNLLGRLFNR